jgi:hypothetical protein
MDEKDKWLKPRKNKDGEWEWPDESEFPADENKINYSPKVRALGYPADLPCEVSHSGSMSYSESGSASLVYDIPQDDLVIAATAMLGTTHAIFTDLICLSIDFEDLGDIDQATGSFKSYRCTFNYGPEEEDDTDLGEENYNLSGKTISYPSKKASWGSGGTALMEADADPPMLTLFTPMAEYTIKFKHVAALPKADLAAAVGKVNSDVWRTNTAETVLFKGIQSSKKYTTNGVEWDVSYSYSINFNEWNKEFRPSTGAWAEIDPKPYGQVSFIGTFGF